MDEPFFYFVHKRNFFCSSVKEMIKGIIRYLVINAKFEKWTKIVITGRICP